MKIAVLLSGGVDSSVALRLLHEQGHDLTAFYLKIWLEDELAYLGDCPWEEDLAYAREVCDQIGVPLKVVSLQTEYLNRVVDSAIEELKRGRTPSPDIWCNQRIKYGAFFDHIDDTYDKVASGHYARVESVNGHAVLCTAPDPIKDQTYFLSFLSQKQLNRALFPIGTYTKKQVRELAEGFDLPNKARKDSQGICFLGKIPYREFVKHHLGELEGPIVDIATGKQLGTHKGFWFHTLGQRQGLGLSGGPWFVVRKEHETNTLLVAHGDVYQEESREELTVENVHINTAPEMYADAVQADGTYNLKVKLRHGPNFYNANVRMLEGNRAYIVLDQQDQGIAPGQYAVLYHNDFCLGAGVIEEEQHVVEQR